MASKCQEGKYKVAEDGNVQAKCYKIALYYSNIELSYVPSLVILILTQRFTFTSVPNIDRPLIKPAQDKGLYGLKMV